MELARQAKCENNIVHRDVIDAMIRQPFSNETKPFDTHLISSGSVIAAVDYDLGVNGAAYYDKDTGNYYISSGKPSAGNRGRAYRNDGVDIYSDSLHPGNYYVGNIEDGEWLQYTINLTSGKHYDIELMLSDDQPDGLITITDNGIPIAENIRVPNTGSVGPKEKITLKNISLSPGIHHLRMMAKKGGFNFYQLSFK
jgi:hypothetical protein